MLKKIKEFRKYIIGFIVGAGLLIGATALALQVNQTGTGLTNVPNGNIPYGSSTNQSLNLLAPGATGSVISIVNGLPTYVATSTLGFSGSGGTGGLGTTSPFTAGYIPEATGTNVTLSNSNIFQDTLGNIGIGTVNPIGVNANSKLTVAGISSQDIIASTTDNTTLSDAILQAYAPQSRVFLGAHGGQQVSSRYGITLGGWGELGAFNNGSTTLGLIIGVQPAAPIVFGTNNLERMRVTSTGLVGIGTTTPIGTLDVFGNYVHFGPNPSIDTAFCASGTNQCLTYSGDDNTSNGVSMEVQNKNPGVNSYSFLGLQNSNTNISGTSFNGLFLNSPLYATTTFGSAANVGNLLGMVNTDGPILFETTTTTGTSTISFVTGSSSTAATRLTIAANGSTTLSSLGTGNLCSASGSLYNCVVSGALSGGSNGENAYWTSASTLGASGDFFDNGTVSGVNATSSTQNFTVQGTGSTNLPFVVNASSTSLVLAVTAGNRVEINTTTAVSTLSLAQGTTAASGVNFGDVITDFYRSAAGTLKTDGGFLSTGGSTFNGVAVGGNFVTAGAAGLSVRGNASAGSAAYAVLAENNVIHTYTSGTGGGLNIGNSGALSQSFIFAPTSGTGIYNTAIMSGIINQTNTANGITRGFLLAPTLTSVFDYRNLETAATTTILSTSTNISTAYNILLNPLTYTSASSSLYNLASASTLNIAGAPKGTTASTTIASSTGITIQGSALTNVTNGISLYVQAPTGATNNYAAIFLGGNVGIGTSTPSFGFVNSGTAQFPNIATSSSGLSGYACFDANNQLVNDSALCITVSAARYKKNIAPLDLSLSELIALQPVSYHYKFDAPGHSSSANFTGLQYGLVADQVQKVDPQLVVINDATSTFEGKTYAPGTVQGLQGINTWIGAFVNWLQKIEKQVLNQDKEIKDLQAKNDKLQSQLNFQQSEIETLQRRK